jgi:lysophospholipase L1-like esterase
MPDKLRILTLGDSVTWGQGLLEPQKLDFLVQQALTHDHPEGVELERCAHSGAVIGANGASGTPQPGEVPVDRPTVIEQSDAYANSPATIDLVLLNGGINDVGVETILNPAALIPSLSRRISSACYDGMLQLLKNISAKFSKPTCGILVIGYYPILSADSDPFGVIKLLSLFGIAVPPFLDKDIDFINPILARCEQFFAESTTALARAVRDSGDARISFVPSGYTGSNAVFASNSLLWGLDLTDDLNPQDPVAAARRPLCNAAWPEPVEVMHRELCYRASAGHPNVQGAIQFHQQILNAIAID